MLLPVLKNFSVAKGVGFDYRFQWNQGIPISDVPTNLSLYEGVLTISNYNGSMVYSVLTSGATSGESGIFYGGASQTPSNGIIDIVIIEADTYALDFSTARYKFMMTPTANPTQPVWLMYGTFTVLAGS